MVKREGLQTLTQTITTSEANVGAKVPQNMRRYIYRVKTVNKYNGANELTLGSKLGAAATATLDKVQHAVQYDTWVDPDDVLEDSLPILILEGSTSAADRYLRGVTDNGDCELTILYVDAE